MSVYIRCYIFALSIGVDSKLPLEEHSVFAMAMFVYTGDLFKA